MGNSGSKSKFDEFLARKGNLLVKNFYSIGELKWKGGTVEVEVVHAYEAGKREQGIYALKFDKPASEGFGSTTTASLDFDEADSLLKALEAMIGFAEEDAGSAREHMEVEFSTRSEYRCGFIQQGRKQTAFMNLSSIGNAFISSKIYDLASAKDLVSKAISKLKELGAR